MTAQPYLVDAPPGSASHAVLGPSLSAKARGAVFTKPAVVDFMLDLVGYTSGVPLWSRRLLEPACGGGGFLLAAARRLVESWRAGDRATDDSVLDEAIRAVEVDVATYEQTRNALTEALTRLGLPELSARRLTRAWLVNADFLEWDHDGVFDYVVGNPPYVRPEAIPGWQLARYRSKFGTMAGRADLYVPFFERGLGLLAPHGRLSYICADAWTKNDYGRALRDLITRKFSLVAYVDMYGLDAFEDSVGAYPSITVIAADRAQPARTATATSVQPDDLRRVAERLTTPSPDDRPVTVPGGGAPWLLRTTREHDAIRDLESREGTIEQVGCRVGIGVATGADGVFISDFEGLDVEDSRKLPLAVNRDVCQGVFTWHGSGVVNPWREDGGLVDLRDYPRLGAYLRPHHDALARRHTAKRDPAARWYKTIDRIVPDLTWQPKLLVPDIRGDGDAIAFDRGSAYPHHNLYYITSTTWDLQALQALLRSGIAHLFIDAYAVRVGGGYLRFQAQYLRRLRIPRWDSLEPAVALELMEAGRADAKVHPRLIERAYRVEPGSLSFLRDWSQP